MALDRASAALLLAVACLVGGCATAAAAAAAADGPVAVKDWRLEPKMELLQERLSSNPYTLGRRMLGADAVQQFFSLKPQCGWDAEEKFCSPLLTNWYLHKGMPSSPFRRAVLMASERSAYCINTHKTESECSKDVKHRCYWYVSKNGKSHCQGIDFYDLQYYGDKNYTARLSSIPASMACPGTKAHELLTCYAGMFSKTCQYMPNCYLGDVDGSKACLPTFVKGYSSYQFFELIAAFNALDPQVFGNCEAVCWVRQAKKCLDASNSGESGCEKLPYCVYDSSGKVCYHRTYEFGDNEYEQTVRRLYGMCVNTENKEDCETYSKGKVTVEKVTVWKDYKQSSQAAQCKL